MKKATTVFLKMVVILIGFPTLALCIFLVPKVGYVAAEMDQELEEK